MPKLLWVGAVAAALMAASLPTAARVACPAHGKAHFYHDRHGARHRCIVRLHRSLRYRDYYHGHDFRLPGRPHRFPDVVS